MVEAKNSTDLIRVLVADDNVAVRSALTAIVNRQPDMKIVAEAGDGLTSVEAFRRSHPDVVLMDLRMPLMDGIEAISAIRSYCPDARIILLTAYAEDGEDIRRSLKAGACMFLSKDIGREELLEALRIADGFSDNNCALDSGSERT